MTVIVAGLPSSAGPLLETETIEGSTLRMFTVACAVVHVLSSSHTLRMTVCESGPPRSEASNVTFWPGVSYVPLLSRSQAKVTLPPSGSDPEPLRPTEAPSFTEYGPPAFAVGGSLDGSRTVNEYEISGAGPVTSFGPSDCDGLKLTAHFALKT